MTCGADEFRKTGISEADRMAVSIRTWAVGVKMSNQDVEFCTGEGAVITAIGSRLNLKGNQTATESVLKVANDGLSEGKCPKT